MPLVVRKFNAQVKDPQSGQMVPAGLLSSDSLQAIEAAESTAITEIQQKGAQTRESIPSDYTELSDSVDELKTQLNDTADGYFPIFLNAAKNAYIDQNTGELTPYNDWTATDYIDCSGLQEIYIYTTVASNYGAFYSDKSVESRIKRLALSIGDNIKDVPENAKYFRISNTNEAMKNTKITTKNTSKITKFESVDIIINEGEKNIGSYVFGESVDNVTGDFITASNYKRSGFISISEYKEGVIYFESDVRTPFCVFYDATKTRISSFIIPVGESFVTIPDNAAFCAISYSRYSGKITMYDSTYTAVKYLGFSNIRDINIKYLDRTDILTQMIRKPLFLVYTDIHDYPVNFSRIASFHDKNIKTHVNYPICLGDMVCDQETEDISWMNTEFGKASLKVIGNHDVLVSGTLPGVTELEAYNKYLKDDIANWGVVQPTDAATLGLTYYYKDTTVDTIKVRMIILDEYYYTEAQHNWFVSVLNDAKTNGISVIVCQHQSNVWNNQAAPLNSQWAFATPGLGFDLYRYDTGYSGEYSTASENRLMAVDSFIADGGEFICWMSGHTHSDQSHTFERNGRKQLSLVFSNAGMSMTSSLRIENYSSDCFQYVAIDTGKKYIYVLRIGEAVDKWFHKNLFMVYDYANHEIVEYH